MPVVRQEDAAEMTVFDCDREERELFCAQAGLRGLGLRVVDEPVTAQTARLAWGSRCVSVSHRNPLRAPALSALKDGGVRLVLTRSVGSNHIDLCAASRLGLRVEGVAYSPDGVADYTLMLILMALRGTKGVLERVGSGNFSLADSRSPELREMTVGIIGAGRIGREVMARLRPFGCRILACGRAGGDAGGAGGAASTAAAATDERTTGDVAASRMPFAKLLGRCDILSFHLPLTTQTYHILNRDNIKSVKRGAYIVNTGRGKLIETEALLDALLHKQLAGVALDVIEGEEGVFYRDCQGGQIRNEALQRLCRMPNVIVTPHIAYYTRRALADSVEKTIDRCLEYEGRCRDNG
ncbi:MAG: D-lactate dehydrogenase VanH-A [Coriobacteriales bacterium]|jgi:D-specific alpha-keto acid dehydrogenase|nr:D-lactate dehydrogenase VanH-A [Coriobacteriales bacterium]